MERPPVPIGTHRDPRQQFVLDSGRVKIIGPTSELSENPMVQQAYMGLM